MAEGTTTTDRHSAGLIAPAIVFSLLLVVGTWVGKTAHFNDPGTYWHVRLGADMLKTGQVPRTDTLTVSRAGAAWVDQSWAFDVGVGWIFERWGWAGLSWATGMLIALTYAALAAWIEARSGRWTIAVAATLTAAACGSIHFLTRPHIFTFIGFLVCLVACWGYWARGSRWVWALPGVVAIWANLHGGFVLGSFVTATSAVGAVVDAPRDRAAWRRAAGFVGVGLLCGLAGLLNPYGAGLYAHVWGLMVSSGVTDLIQEHRPGKFLGIEVRVFEIPLMLLLLAPCVWTRRVSRYDTLHAAVWLHLALGAVRHLPLFGFAFAPVVAQVLSLVVATKADEAGEQGGRVRVGWVGLLVAGLVAAGSFWIVRDAGPRAEKWPLNGLRRLNAEPVTARLFHDQDWGGLISQLSNPERKAWIDDRFELWGRAGELEYLDMIRGRSAWDARAREFDLVWARPKSGLSRRLESDGEWEELHRDSVSALYGRRGRSERVPP